MSERENWKWIDDGGHLDEARHFVRFLSKRPRPRGSLCRADLDKLVEVLEKAIETWEGVEVERSA